MKSIRPWLGFIAFAVIVAIATIVLVSNVKQVNADNLAKHKAEAVQLQGFRAEVSKCMLQRYHAVTIAISTDGRSGLFESERTGERFHVTNTQVCLDDFNQNAGRTDRESVAESN